MQAQNNGQSFPGRVAGGVGIHKPYRCSSPCRPALVPGLAPGNRLAKAPSARPQVRGPVWHLHVSGQPPVPLHSAERRGETAHCVTHGRVRA